MIQINEELKNSFSSITTNDLNPFPTNVVCFQFTVPTTLSYYVGHFPNQPVLPAVAFIDISLYFISEANKIFKGTLQKNYSEIPLLKIEKIVAPGDLCFIYIQKNTDLQFGITWSLFSNYAETQTQKNIADLKLQY